MPRARGRGDGNQGPWDNQRHQRGTDETSAGISKTDARISGTNARTNATNGPWPKGRAMARIVAATLRFGTIA